MTGKHTCILKIQYHIKHLWGFFSLQTQVLRIVLGYLAADRERRPLLIQVSVWFVQQPNNVHVIEDFTRTCVCLQVLRSVSQAWANPSAVKHTPLEQQLYVTKALLLSVNLLTDSELQELRSGTLSFIPKHEWEGFTLCSSTAII